MLLYSSTTLAFCSIAPITNHLCDCKYALAHAHAWRARHSAAVQQYAGYYSRRAAFCEGGVITVIRVAVGGSWALLGEHGDSLEKQVLSLTGVKLRKYINTLRWPTYLTPAREKWLLINTAAPQLLMMNPIQLNWPGLDVEMSPCASTIIWFDLEMELVKSEWVNVSAYWIINAFEVLATQVWTVSLEVYQSIVAFLFLG